MIHSIEYCKYTSLKFNPDEYFYSPQNSSEKIKRRTLGLEFITFSFPDKLLLDKCYNLISIATVSYSKICYYLLLILFLLSILIQMNCAKMRVPNDQILLKLEPKIGRMLSLSTPFHILEEF